MEGVGRCDSAPTTDSGRDLRLRTCGIEECKRGHRWGPAVRDYYLIHYVLEGSGWFKTRKQHHTIGQGQIFLICPGDISCYGADDKSPWTYTWVGFEGRQAGKYVSLTELSPERPILTVRDRERVAGSFHRLVTSARCSDRAFEARTTGLLYQLLSDLIETLARPKCRCQGDTGSSVHIEAARRFIEANYCRGVQVGEVASHADLDRSYLCQLFKHYVGVSPKQYIDQLRIERACQLMADPRLSISDISRSVGYTDPLHFSKAFRRMKQVCPSQYRDSLGSQTSELDQSIEEPDTEGKTESGTK